MEIEIKEKFTRIPISEVTEEVTEENTQNVIDITFEPLKETTEPIQNNSFEIVKISSIPTICLNMIVKNESKIIERLLESVTSFIDCYCICDTGSTDNTIEIITKFFKSKNIPGKIVYEPFKDFAHNRNFALKSCFGMSDFVLLVDADMKLKVIDFDKKLLEEADTFLILQGSENFYYQNTRIVRNNGLYNYYGVTHEYINTPSNNRQKSIKKNEIFIEDIGDGGSKSDKYERDIRLLLKGLEENPNSDRYHFYLANSYFDSGKTELAIETYKKRIEIGGWDQEIWYSYYKIGMGYKNLNKMADAVYWWLEAYNYLPIRVENLYEIINHYRYIGKHKLVKIFYELSKSIINDKTIDKDKFLFLHNDVYTYKIDYEYTISANYLNVTNINDQAVTVFNYCDAYNTISNVLSNMKFYKDILKPIKTIDLSFSMNKNIGEKNICFHSSSSCILPNKNKDGYIFNARMVNYRIDDKGNYLDCDKHIITTNKFFELDKDLNTGNWSKVFNVDDSDRLYIGVEDIRIFNNENDDSIDFIGTGYHTNNKIGIVVGKYDTDKSLLETREIKPSFSDNGCEKNWVFVNYKSKNHIVYKWKPLQICEINNETNQLNLVEEKSMPRIFDHVRGSTCGFKFEEEIYFITHLVSYEKPRVYYHLFAVFDLNMNLKRYSAPFKFEGEPIEYTLSLIVEENRVIVPYSCWDNTTKIGVYDRDYIESKIIYTP